MPIFSVQPNKHRYLKYPPPPRGEARIKVEAEFQLQVYVLDTANLRLFLDGQKSFKHYVNAVADPELDGMAKIPYADFFYVVLLNRGSVPSAAFCEVFL